MHGHSAAHRGGDACTSHGPSGAPPRRTRLASYTIARAPVFDKAWGRGPQSQKYAYFTRLVLSSPLLLVGLAVLASAWVYCFILTDQDAPLTVAGFELRRREKLIALVPFTILVVALCGLINSLIYVIFLSSLCSLPHASFHEVTELDALDVLELEGLKSAVPNV